MNERPPISDDDWKYNKEFGSWFEDFGPKWDQEDDPAGEYYSGVMWWAWEAWRAARRVKG